MDVVVREPLLYSSRMTKTEQDILATLVELEHVVETMARANPKPSLLPIFTRLDTLTATLPAATEPLLLHYLHKKSYQKARLFLQGRDGENQAGNCRHVDKQGQPWEPPQREGGEMPPAR